MFDMIFDIVSGIKINDIPELFRNYVGIFLFDDRVEFLK
jgi:hypothetical protein